MNLDFLYDVKETPVVRYVSYATDNHRYDFGIVFTQQFEGKSIVMSLQNLALVLLCHDDITHSSYWMEKLGVAKEDESSIRGFFESVLYRIDRLKVQY